MIIYLIGFVWALVLISRAEKMKNPKIFWSICIIGILLPSYIAAVRSIGVGVDTAVYGEVAFKYAIRYPLDKYLTFFLNSPLFYTLWYISSNVFGNIAGSFFIVEFLIELSILSAIVKGVKDEGGSIVRGMAVYYFVFYCYSLNIMRQFMALAFILLMYEYLYKENKIIRYIIGTVALYFVHSTALIGLFIPVLNWLYKRLASKSSIKKYALYIVTMLSVVLCLTFYNRLLEVIVSFEPNFSHYGSTKINVSGTFTMLFFFVLVSGWEIICAFILRNRNANFSYLIYLQIIGWGTFLINLFSNDAYRLSFYFLIFSLPGYSTMLNTNCCSEVAKRDKKILWCLSCIILFVFWYIVAVKWRVNNTVPYKSNILGI